MRDVRGLAGRVLALLAILAFVGCQDAVGPRGDSPLAGPQFDAVAGDSADVAPDANDLAADSSDASVTPLLRQGPGAPALETYQVSFWVRKNAKKNLYVSVDYLPRAGHTQGDQFLLFYVPKDALVRGGGGSRLAKHDSVLVTMTIDPATFAVDFQPSGMIFKKDNPARLLFYYENADPDLNGDAVVDATDQALEAQLQIVYRANEKAKWHKIKIKGLTGGAYPWVMGDVRHFSQYAVSW